MCVCVCVCVCMLMCVCVPQLGHSDSVKTLAAYLMSTGNTMNTLLKVRIIFRWICDKIKFAFTHTNIHTHTTANTSVTVVRVLKTRTANAEGYATLFDELMTELNIKSITIKGYAKMFGYRIGDTFNAANHWWNAVFFYGKWHLFDTTMSAGYWNGVRFVKV